MRSLLGPVLRPIVRRDESEVARAAASFAIRTDDGRRFVDDLGRAFLGGFNAMVDLPDREAVVRRGQDVPVHFRPFYFEGAAMGYLPRIWWDADHTLDRVERHLLDMTPAFLFLYYVGLGFWYGFRHPSRPDRLGVLEPHVDPLYFPLCYDGYGFKLAFFDYSRSPSVIERLERVAEPFRPYAYQGFGRALHFVFMDDPEGFRRLRDAVPAAHRFDLEAGRALATGFTGVDRPDRLFAFLEAATDEEELRARLGGITWAMTARERNDRAYFEECVGRAPGGGAELLLKLPDICNAVLGEIKGYGEWQLRTRDEALAAYQTQGGAEIVGRERPVSPREPGDPTEGTRPPSRGTKKRA